MKNNYYCIRKNIVVIPIVFVTAVGFFIPVGSATCLGGFVVSVVSLHTVVLLVLVGFAAALMLKSCVERWCCGALVGLSICRVVVVTAVFSVVAVVVVWLFWDHSFESPDLLANPSLLLVA